MGGVQHCYDLSFCEGVRHDGNPVSGRSSSSCDFERFDQGSGALKNRSGTSARVVRKPGFRTRKSPRFEVPVGVIARLPDRPFKYRDRPRFQTQPHKPQYTVGLLSTQEEVFTINIMPGSGLQHQLNVQSSPELVPLCIYMYHLIFPDGEAQNSRVTHHMLDMKNPTPNRRPKNSVP